MKTFFLITAVLTMLLGIAWVLLPQTMLESWGAYSNEIGEYMGRRYGAMFFGYSIIFWLVRSAGPSPMRRAILAGGVVATSVMAVLSLVGVLGGVVGPLMYSTVAIEALLAAGFIYFYRTSPH